jgi:VIT1/CCC1 family predicted Fe2+/Mn2+ transporter
MDTVPEVLMSETSHPSEPHGDGVGNQLNRLRAGVLGANDGIVSTAGLVVGVTAAGPANTAAILTAGVAGLLSGAVSMAVGEYVSVSTQRDTERALISKEQRELHDYPETEFNELIHLLRRQGLKPATARMVAQELTEHDALGTHLNLELGIDSAELTSPWQAAAASASAFTVGALLPVLAVALTPEPGWRIPVTFAMVVLTLALTGWSSARLGGARPSRAIVRIVIGGALGMLVTWTAGALLGSAV